MRVIVHNTIRVAEIVELPDGGDISELPHDRSKWPAFGAEVLEQFIEFIEPETVKQFGGEDPFLADAQQRAERRDVGYWAELVRHTKDTSWKPP